MNHRLSKLLSVRYHRTINSIAFLPAVITLLFLCISFGMVLFDFSAVGKEFKANLHWLSLKDATTARSIISSIVSGIISLAVFSFSLVMIILNQTASQMSNRILDKLIGNKFQQSVLGVYSGTIVFALFLLSTIRDIDSGVSVPALSTYLLIALTVVDLFLFIYFLHYITQSVKYETIIRQIAEQTKKAIRQSCTQPTVQTSAKSLTGIPVLSPKDGNFQGFEQKALLQICTDANMLVSFIYPYGSYVIKGMPYLMITGVDTADEDLVNRIHLSTIVEPDITIDNSYYYGFRQLMEVAVKALSPGINDPQTAVASLEALGSLFARRMNEHPQNYFVDNEGKTRIVAAEQTFDEVFDLIMLPIWDYGKLDRVFQGALRHILKQLQSKGSYQSIDRLLNAVEHSIEEKEASLVATMAWNERDGTNEKNRKP